VLLPQPFPASIARALAIPAIAVIARSPIEHLIQYKKQRGFNNLGSGQYTRGYVSPTMPTSQVSAF
jgi:hypothetical protein